MSDLTVSLVQAFLHWESPTKNRKSLEKLISSISKTDLVVLPEMFTTAFTMDALKNAETMNGESVQWMQQVAKEKQACICGSLIIEEEGNYYNRLIWVEPAGTVQSYDKRHLFSMANEDENFTAGKERLIVNLKGWKICPLVCYDLRFPVWSRNTDSNYDLLIYIANWPSPRASAWEKLLYARAIENQCYTLGVNRIGKDEKGLNYIGGSMLIDMKGELIVKAAIENEEIISHSISLIPLNDFRKKFPVGNDADRFTLEK